MFARFKSYQRRREESDSGANRRFLQMVDFVKKMMMIFGIIAAVICLTWEHADAQSLGESMLTKGDSIAVYVDAEDWEAMKVSREGQVVKMKVLENIVKFDKKLVNKGQSVYATVLKRSRGGAYAGSGKLVLKIDSTHSTGKTMIPLRGGAEFKGKSGADKKVISIVLFPIGWLIKGGDVEFPEGKNVFKPVTVDDVPLKYQK